MTKCRVKVPSPTTKYGITVNCLESIEDIKKKIRATQNIIKTTIQQAKVKRENKNQKLALIYALIGRTNKANALKAIVNAKKNVNYLEENKMHR